MKIKTANFECSNTDWKKCPDKKIPEYAFIGRSNVGKSSLINALCNKKGLAKTSSTPGKTQLINHFIINIDESPWYLVDLPGYGYAKTSKEKKAKFQKIISDYLIQRKNLLCTFVLIDSRHLPQKIDISFMEWMAEKELPFTVVFTKTDKLTKNQLQFNIENYKKEMLKDWEIFPDYFLSSSSNKEGLEKILEFIETTNKLIFEGN